MKQNLIKKYISLGIHLFPLRPKTKKPATEHGFKDAKCHPAHEEIWIKNPNLNIGIATGKTSGITIVDIDSESGGAESYKFLLEEYKLDPCTLRVNTPRGGFHLIYKDRIGFQSSNGILPGIDIKGDGGYVVAPPSVHPNGKEYQFENLANFLSLDQTQFESSLKEFPYELFQKIKKSKKKVYVQEDGKVNAGNRFEYLRSFTGKIRRAGVSHASALNLIGNENQTRCNPPKTEEEVRAIVDGIYKLDVSSPLISSPHTDLGNAERLKTFSEDSALFVSRMEKWLVYDDKRYKVDDTSAIIQQCKSMLRFAQDLSATMPESDIKPKLQKHLKKCESRAKIQSMISLAEGEMSVSPDELDQDPLKFNVANGTLCLKTGDLFPHNKKDKITKISNVIFDPIADCPRFEKFLFEVFDNNVELIEYFQKIVGYSLTGLTSEQCLFILHGSGSNGKSTLINILKKLLGEYCRTADISTFTFRQSEQIRNDLARLFDSRLVTSVEIQEGKFLDESVIKQITGGDPITSRFLFKEHFEYIPKWKLFLAVNHLPHITGNDNGIWRRLKTIPFSISFMGANKDPDLCQKLEAELSGILNWAIQGCIAWQKYGLAEPQIVSSAIDMYRQDEDVMGCFLSDHIEVGIDYYESATALFETYVSAQKALGQRTISQKLFSQKLAAKGFEKHRGSDGRVNFIGLKLKPSNFRSTKSLNLEY